jgi:hypothetical protein
MRGALTHLLPSDTRYSDRFTRFELFASLEHFLTTGRALGMSFMARGLREGIKRDSIADLQSEAAAAGPKWKPLRAGLLDTSDAKTVTSVLESFRESVQEVKNSYRMW